MDLKRIEQLADIINKKNLSEITVEQDGTKITVKQNITNVINEADVNVISNNITKVNDNMNIASNESTPCDYNLKTIKSPMVGMFYSAPSPDSDDFIKVGQKIKKGDVVCIIEAMKLMNEIISDVDGEVVEILVNNSEAVSFSQDIIKVK